MAHLQLSLLGAMQVALDGQPVTGFESSKVRALLGYVAVERERQHNRDTLTGLLWPDQPEQMARTNLRQALSNLRRTIQNQDANPPFLLITRESVQFNPEGDSSVDVATFTALLDACTHHKHRRLELCTPCTQRLTEAVKLYRGPFLDGLFLHDSVAFEEWMLLQREMLQRRVLLALYQLAVYHERRAAYDDAYRYAWRQIEIDPWREEAYLQAMRVLVLRGERTAALAQYEACRRALQDGLGVEPAEEITALYERIRASEDDTPLTGQQLALPSARRHNLPPQPTPFIGRERELGELAQLIEQPDYRLITLVGQGGSGKTRLALQAAAEQIEAFSDGVCFVPLAPVPSSDYLASTIGAALGFSFSGQEDERTQLLNELRDKEMLLVLDNVEHLLDGTDLVTAIFQEAPSVTILTTSRERLNLQRECSLAIEGLPYPEAGAPQPLESYAAVQLFLQSARRADSSFTLSGEDQHAVDGVVRICRLAGGLPLAIELAAAWAPVMSTSEIADEITNNLDFLDARLRDIPERHRSMRAVFDHSWKLLTAEERDLFARLSVFRGGFDREAAEQGAGASLRLLSSLASKSFLHRNPLGRYEIHELLRQYGASKLLDIPGLGGRDEAQDRHCRYYAKFVQRREDRLRGESHLTAIEEIGAEIDNIREAWRWAVERAKADEIWQLIDGLWFYHDKHGLFQEEYEAFGRAAAALSPSAGTEHALSKERAIVLGRVLARQGSVSGARMGRIEESRKLLERSVALLSKFGAKKEAAFSLNILGDVARLQSEYSQARAFLEESLALFREAGDRWGMAYSLSDLGNVAYLLGEYDEARRLHEESLLISRLSGDRRAMTFCLNDMASVFIAVGDYDTARGTCQELLAVSQEIDHHWGFAIALYQLGSIAAHTSDYSQAQMLLQESLASFRHMGARQQATLPLRQLGHLAYAQQDYQLARRLFQEVLAVCRDINYRRGTADALNMLGRVDFAISDDQMAQTHLCEALATAFEIEAWPLVLDVLVSMAAIWVAWQENGHRERAKEIVSLVCSHPASEKQTRDQAQELLAIMEEAQFDERVKPGHETKESETLERTLLQVMKGMC
jgi:predicted ATPase/DNA-binding SARP family transcriptional activator